MCLIVFAWQQHAEFPLIVAANRDEQHARAAAPMAWWPEDEELLAGRDLQADGSWLALATTGRFAAITNYRESPARTAARSRGELVINFAGGTQTATDFAAAIDHKNYAGFSGLFKDREDLVYASNRDHATHRLPPGFYGLSNAHLDTPWPKLERSRHALKDCVTKENFSLDALLALLAPDQEQLSNYEQTTLLPDSAYTRDATFVVHPRYGTRCSTAVIYRRDGHIEVAERRYTADAQASGESRFVFLEA